MTVRLGHSSVERKKSSQNDDSWKQNRRCRGEIPQGKNKKCIYVSSTYLITTRVRNSIPPLLQAIIRSSGMTSTEHANSFLTRNQAILDHARPPIMQNRQTFWWQPPLSPFFFFFFNQAPHLLLYSAKLPVSSGSASM